MTIGFFTTMHVVFLDDVDLYDRRVRDGAVVD
jgi:hypothetical protein